MMLYKINYYRNAERVDARLDLVLMKIPEEESRASQHFERFLENFAPAIAGGLLKVVSVELTEADAYACLDAQ